MQPVKDGARDDVQRHSEPVHDVGAKSFGNDLTAQVADGGEVHTDRDFQHEEGDETENGRAVSHVGRPGARDHRHQ